jgi:hypothetical protein
MSSHTHSCIAEMLPRIKHYSLLSTRTWPSVSLIFFLLSPANQHSTIAHTHVWPPTDVSDSPF